MEAIHLTDASARNLTWMLHQERLASRQTVVRLMRLTISITLFAPMGCRSIDNAQVDLMERELRQQENYIYELEDYLVEYSEKLRECRCAAYDEAIVAKPSSAGEEDEPELVNDYERRRQLRERAASNQRTRQQQTPSENEAQESTDTLPFPENNFDNPGSLDIPGSLEVPDLEVGPTGASLGRRLIDDSSIMLESQFTEDGRLAIPNPVDFAEDDSAYNEIQMDEQFVARSEAQSAGNETLASTASAVHTTEPLITDLSSPENGSLTAPEKLAIRHLFADQVGEDVSPSSLLVIVEGLNAADEPVDIHGAISLMITAPVNESTSEVQRLERWDFTVDEAQTAWQSSHLGDGLHLELPLPADSIPSSELELWARFVTADGTKLLTKRQLNRSELTTLDHETGQPKDATAPAPIKLAAEDVATTNDHTGANRQAATNWRKSDRTSEPSIEGAAVNRNAIRRSGWVRAASSNNRNATTSTIAPPQSTATQGWNPLR